MNSSTCAISVTRSAAKSEALIPIFSKCQNCKVRKQASFCNLLPVEAMSEFTRLKSFRIYGPGERLFSEGSPVDEVMIVCDGAATITFNSCKGGVVMLGLSEAGEVLGLSCVLSGRDHETTCEALVTTRVAVISRADFLRFLERFPAAALSATLALSRKVNRAYEKIRLIGSGLSVPERLASWLLRMQESGPESEVALKITITHERIAQLLGASRESITRALSQMKKLGVVEVRGIHLYVRNRNYLRSLLDPLVTAKCPSRRDVMSVTDSIAL